MLGMGLFGKTNGFPLPRFPYDRAALCNSCTILSTEAAENVDFLVTWLQRVKIFNF